MMHIKLLLDRLYYTVLDISEYYYRKYNGYHMILHYTRNLQDIQ